VAALVTTHGTAERERLAALAPLVERALDLAPQELAVWLAALRAEQPALASEVEALLSAEDELDARGFLGGRALTGMVWPDGSLEGKQVGAYVLERPLGRGGMGSVWAARRSDGRYQGRAAVKLLNLALLDPVGSARFRREGTALALLAHPNIARLLDAGVTDGGQPYLILEHVDGIRIDQYCDERKLGVSERVVLFQQVLDAVAHAHTHLIVHRDLKPSNILVTADGTVKLLDFGIAKLIEERGGTENTDLTGAGGTPFTPEYAAPEQVSGGEITTATDIYALGVLLYVLLAGRHPTGRTGLSVAEHLRATVDTEPPRLSSAVVSRTGDAEDLAAARRSTPNRLRREFLGDLDNIVGKALKKPPGERYPAVGALAEDLRRYLAHEPVSARPDSLRYRAGKFLLRNRAPVAVGTLAAFALIGAAGRERQLRGQAEAETRKAVAVEQYLVSVFGAADPFSPPEAQQGDTAARALLDRGAERIDTSLAEDPEVRAELRVALGRVYANLAFYDRAEVQLRRALAERRAVYGPRHVAVAEAMDELGKALFRQGHLDEADSLLRGALAQRRTLLGNQHDATAESLEHLAELLGDREDFVGAGATAREALAIRRALHGDSSLTVAESRHGLARLLHSQGDYADAAALLRQALLVRERRLGSTHPLTAQTMYDLASAEEFLGNFEGAERLYRLALGIQQRSLGPSHPSVARSLNGLGQMLFHRTTRAQEADSLVREALAVNRRAFGERHSAVSTNLGNLAVMAREKGDFDQAERLLREALAIDRALYGPEHTYIGFDLNELAGVLRLRGRPDAAIPLLREAQAQSRRLVGEDHRNTLSVTLHLARALRESGSLTEAESLFRSALVRLEPQEAEARTLTIPAQVALGRTLTAMGRIEDALPLLERTLTLSHDEFGPEHWRTAEARLALGECLLLRHQYRRAEGLLREAYVVLDRDRRAQPLVARDAGNALHRLYRAWGKPAEAQKYAPHRRG
jgi:serine/threonine protein kinase/Tfp pilus assembly protein PilF